MKWTEKQREAIETRHKNILVAAAAGSGKTAVLVERIKTLIIDDGVSIDRMLIVTFTNAAAAEMKEKIVDAIVKQIAHVPAQAQLLRKQLDIIYKANISTFHSFALEVIRRYFHVIDIDPSFRVCDEAEGEILRTQAVDLLFEEYFEKRDDRFFDFLDRYAGAKSFENVKRMVMSAYNKLQSIPEPYAWLDAHIEAFNCDETKFLQSDLYRILMAETVSAWENAAEYYKGAAELLAAEGCDLLAAKVIAEEDACRTAAEATRTGGYAAASAAMAAFTPVRLVATKGEKEAYNAIKDAVKELHGQATDAIKELRSGFFAYSLAEYVSELNAVYPAAVLFRELILRYRDLYRAQKQEKNVIDFADIEHCALEILKDESVAAEYRQKFEYIFIDEYQDSNLIQETLIGCIKRTDNLFMVGDVKQSIYKFRLAEPELFLRKYEAFKAAVGENDTKIDLNMNFRSKAGVISFTNDLFAAAMAGYDADAALYQGVSYTGDLAYETELHIVCKADEDVVLPDEVAELKSAEREAIVTAALINDSLGKRIYDVKLQAERPLQKKDIVILMRATRGTAEVFRKTLAAFDIDAHVDDNDGYFDTVEIELFLNLLRVIDNKRQDVPLIGTLHSVVFDFSADELAEVRLFQKEGSYLDAFCAYAEEDTALAQKCHAALEHIAQWKSLANALPLPELLWRLMQETGLYLYIGAMPAGEQRLANLRAMIDKAEAFAGSHTGGIYEFLSHIERMRSRKIAVPQVRLISERDDAVRIMTVHKSKGLEYPLVIVAGLGKRFYRGREDGLTLHKDIGVGLTLVNREQHWKKKTLTQKLIECKQQREDAEEELRILYVACTRAMDKLVLLGSLNKREEDIVRKIYGNPADINSAGCYLDVVIPAVYGKVKTLFHAQDAIPVRNVHKGAARRDLAIAEAEITDATLYAEIDRRLSYVYPYEKQLAMKSKYSVTELVTGGRDDGLRAAALDVPLFLTGKKGFSAAEKGVIYHKIVEQLDFAEARAVFERDGVKPLIAYINELILSLSVKEILIEDEPRQVDAAKVADFIVSDIGRRAADAQRRGKLHKEVPFVLKVIRDSCETLVQGVIDCWFEEEGGAVLIDYKTNRITDTTGDAAEALIETYKGQIDFYSRAIEEIKGIPVKEKYLYLIGLSQAIKV